MISIGNDIIALNAINRPRTNDVRFHSKFITPAELSLYQDQLPFGSFVWLLWSVKESVYKYLQRLDPELIFSPTKTLVQSINIPVIHPIVPINDTWEADMVNDALCNGTVSANGQVLYYRSVIQDDLIATVVTDDPTFQNIYWGIQAISSPERETQSASVRVFLLNKIQILFPLSKLDLQKNPAGYPILLVDGNARPDILISFSHHGLFIFYSFKHKPVK